MDKKVIRKRIIKERKFADPFLLNQYSQTIIDKLINDELFINKNHIAIYYPIQQEVNTLSLINHLLKQGKHIYLPKINGHDMDFYEIKSLDDLEEGPFHLKEPNNSMWIDKKSLDIIVVPLVAYNSHRYRIGYGKGYYDRYLKDCLCPTIGLAYSFQKADFSEEAYDIPLDKIITEI